MKCGKKANLDLKEYNILVIHTKKVESVTKIFHFGFLIIVNNSKILSKGLNFQLGLVLGKVEECQNSTESLLCVLWIHKVLTRQRQPRRGKSDENTNYFIVLPIRNVLYVNFQPWFPFFEGLIKQLWQKRSDFFAKLRRCDAKRFHSLIFPYSWFQFWIFLKHTNTFGRFWS